jgi:peroxiredoxin
MRYQTATGVVLFFLVYSLGFYRPNDPWRTTTATMVNQKAPTFALPEVFGGQIDFQSYRGQPVLLVFWTMSNGDCRRELSLVSQIAPDYRSKGMAVVSIHAGDAVGLKEFLTSNKISVTALVDGDELVSESYRVTGEHKLVLVGRDGTIKQATQDMADEKLLRKWIDIASEG